MIAEPPGEVREDRMEHPARCEKIRSCGYQICKILRSRLAKWSVKRFHRVKDHSVLRQREKMVSGLAEIVFDLSLLCIADGGQSIEGERLQGTTGVFEGLPARERNGEQSEEDKEDLKSCLEFHSRTEGEMFYNM